MKERYLFIIAFIVMCLYTQNIYTQQSTVYTHFLLNAYSYNPAVAGSTEALRVNVLYRNQWVGFSADAPKTMLINIYSSFKKKEQMAWGAQIISDRTGLLSKTMSHITYAYHVKVTSKIKLGMGISLGINQLRIKLYDVRMYDEGDEVLTGNILNTNVFDAHSGLLLYGKKFFFGISSLSIISTKYTYVQATGKNIPVYYINGGYSFKLLKDIDIQPSFLFKFSQPVPYQPEYLIKIQWKDIFWIGGSYRTYSNASAMFGINAFNKKLNFGYAYDYSINGIQKYSSGSHEIFIGYIFKRKEKTKEEEEFKVPDNSIKQSIKNKKR